MSEFKPFDDRLNGLIAALSPAGAVSWPEIAKELRKSQQQRIKRKKPRTARRIRREAQPLRAKTGRIKRAMFAKLRTSRYMKATGRENSAVVEFTGKVQRIARMHQYGLKDRPTAQPGRAVCRAPVTRVQPEDEQLVELAIKHLAADCCANPQNPASLPLALPGGILPMNNLNSLQEIARAIRNLIRTGMS
jgi:phage virion morphogenesis protein